MLSVVLTSSVAFIITFFAIPGIIKIAQQKKLYDIPDERKLHTRPISSLGGVGIFGGFFLASLLSISVRFNPEFQYFFAAATVIFFLGIKDDILIISAFKKLAGQIVAAAIIIHLGGIRIDSMHGFLGITTLPETVSLALSYISIIVIINAYNLIDGVDGLAASLGLLTMTVFGSYFYLVDLPAYSVMSFSMAGSLLAFLIFNYNPAKIFMGDSGSLLLGLVNAILVIKFITVADNPAVLYPIESAVAVGFAILMVPMVDTLRVFSIRIAQGRSPFSPDRNHVHHLLLDRGMNHKFVALCCLLANIGFIVLAYFTRSLGPTYVLLSTAGMAFSLMALLVYLKKPSQNINLGRQVPTNNSVLSTPSTKVVALRPDVAVAEN